jgi:hypothetical protein
MNGYSRTAGLVGTHCEFAIFRRFMVLNAKNLLYMQGELMHLEAELRAVAIEDKESKDQEKAKFEFCIHALKGPHESPDTGLQWSKILAIRAKLKDYSLWMFHLDVESKWTDH